MRSTEAIAENGFEEHLSEDILERRYGEFAIDGDDTDRKWRSICLEAVRYMEGWTNIKRIPKGPHNDAELQKYFASKPAIVQRLKQIEEDGSRPPQTSRWW